MNLQTRLFLMIAVVFALLASYGISANAMEIEKPTVKIDFNKMIDQTEKSESDLTASLNDIYDQARKDVAAEDVIDLGHELRVLLANGI